MNTLNMEQKFMLEMYYHNAQVYQDLERDEESQKCVEMIKNMKLPYQVKNKVLESLQAALITRKMFGGKA